MRALARRIWAFLDRIGWMIAIVFVGIALYQLHHDEQAHDAEARHTRKVQVQGGPVAVCLLDALRAVTPLLLKVPSVDAPLTAYVRLQSHRYPGVVCPEK